MSEPLDRHPFFLPVYAYRPQSSSPRQILDIWRIKTHPTVTLRSHLLQSYDRTYCYRLHFLHRLQNIVAKIFLKILPEPSHAHPRNRPRLAARRISMRMAATCRAEYALATQPPVRHMSMGPDGLLFLWSRQRQPRLTRPGSLLGLGRRRRCTLVIHPSLFQHPLPKLQAATGSIAPVRLLFAQRAARRTLVIRPLLSAKSPPLQTRHRRSCPRGPRQTANRLLLAILWLTSVVRLPPPCAPSYRPRLQDAR